MRNSKIPQNKYFQQLRLEYYQGFINGQDSFDKDQAN